MRVHFAPQAKKTVFLEPILRRRRLKFCHMEVIWTEIFEYFPTTSEGGGGEIKLFPTTSEGGGGEMKKLFPTTGGGEICTPVLTNMHKLGKFLSTVSNMYPCSTSLHNNTLSRVITAEKCLEKFCKLFFRKLGNSKC